MQNGPVASCSSRHTYKDGSMPKGHRNQLKELSMAQTGTIGVRKEITDYNANRKIHIHEYIRTYICTQMKKEINLL